MPSLQQTPTTEQQVSPAVLIDGVSQQEIDAAVKAHVRAKRAARQRLPQPEPVSNERAAIQTALNYIEHRLKWLDELLMDDCRDGQPKGALLVQSVGQVALEELFRLRAENPASFKDVQGPLMKISGLCYCMKRAHDAGTSAGYVLKKLQEQVDALSEAVEIAAIADRDSARASAVGVAA